MIDLKKEFETFIEIQADKSPEDSLTDLMSTPYCRLNGELSAMFHMFQYAFHLGVTETTKGIFGEDAMVKKNA